MLVHASYKAPLCYSSDYIITSNLTVSFNYLITIDTVSNTQWTVGTDSLTPALSNTWLAVEYLLTGKAEVAISFHDY